MRPVEGAGRGREIVAGRSADSVDVALGIGREVPHLVFLTPTPVGREPDDRGIGSRASRGPGGREGDRVAGNAGAADRGSQSVRSGIRTQYPLANCRLTGCVRKLSPASNGTSTAGHREGNGHPGQRILIVITHHDRRTRCDGVRYRSALIDRRIGRNTGRNNDNG